MTITPVEIKKGPINFRSFSYTSTGKICLKFQTGAEKWFTVYAPGLPAQKSVTFKVLDPEQKKISKTTSIDYKNQERYKNCLFQVTGTVNQKIETKYEQSGAEKELVEFFVNLDKVDIELIDTIKVISELNTF